MLLRTAAPNLRLPTFWGSDGFSSRQCRPLLSWDDCGASLSLPFAAYPHSETNVRFLLVPSQPPWYFGTPPVSNVDWLFSLGSFFSVARDETLA